MKKLLFILTLSICFNSLFSASYTANSGFLFWDQAASWSPSGVPGTGDTAIINNSGTNMYIMSNTTVGELRITNGTFAYFGAVSLTVETQLNIGSGSNTCILNVPSSASLVVEGNIDFNGTTASDAIINLNAGSNSFTIGGDITYTGNGQIDCNATSTTVTFNGTGSQSLPGSSESADWGPITINKTSGTVTVLSTLGTSQLGGALHITSGTLATGGNSITLNNRALTMGANGNLSISNGNFPGGFSSATLNSSSTVTFSGSGTQNMGLATKTVTFGNVVISGSGTVVNTGTSNSIAGTMSINSGTFNVNSIPLGGAGTINVSSGATLLMSGTSSLPTTSTINFSNGSTAQYTGSSQTVGTADYSNLTLSGSSGTYTCSTGVNVGGVLNITNSSTLTTGGNLTILSTASQTGGIVDLSNGTVSGVVTCQRYVAAQSVAGNPGWWYMIGSPVNGQTLASLSDDLQTSGFTGSTNPSFSFTSIVTYSPDSANAQSSESYYPKAKNITDPMTLGQGFYVYIAGDGIGSMPKTIDWTGSISENVTVTMDQAGTMDFNLVANPLPCAVNVNVGTNGTNVTQSYYQDDAGNFPSGNGVLAMGEAVWFEVSADGATYDFNETDKLTSAEVDQFHKSTKKGTATVAGKELEIIIHRPYGHGDKARIILNDDGNATLNKDPYLDGIKIPNFYGYTNVSFTYGTEEFSLNQIPSNFAGPITFPIRFWRETAFNQNVQLGFEIKGVEDFKANGICLTLEEIATGNMIPLDKDYSTQVNWFDQNNQPLYNLHLTSSFEEAATDASCYGFNDGTVTANLNTTAKYDFYLTNLIGDTLQSEVGYVGNSYTFNNVNAGEYKIIVNDPNGCGMIARPVSIQEPAPVISLFTTKTNEVDLTFNSNISFNNISANAQSYFWRFGDGNTSSDESPTHAYQDTGIFNVEMIALNGTCTDTSSKTINVIKSGSDVGIIEVETNPYLSLFQRNEKVEVRFNLPVREAINAQLFNSLGQQVWSSFGNTFQNEQIMLDLPQANTFYILNIKGETFETNYKLIRN